MDNIIGKTLNFKTPSGMNVVIREQNGDDDEIISKMKNATDGSAVNKFIAAIVMDCNGHRPTYENILKWKVRDKYYVLLKSRIFSIGDNLIFKYKCINNDCGKETEYEENLNPYDRDFSKPIDETNNDFDYQIQPYETGEASEIELLLSSGKKIKYELLNGNSEKMLLAANKDEISKNTELIVRSIQWYNEGKWQKLSNFRIMSPRDMKEIRSHINKHDLPFEAISELKCPYCKNSSKVSLLAQPDFFFPQEP